MKLFFKLYRIFLLVLLNLFFLSLVGLLHSVTFYKSTQRKIRIIALVKKLWAYTLCRVLGIHVAVSGDYLNGESGLTVCNHLSYLDILVLASLRPSVFVAKQEVRKWPLLGLMARAGGTIFIKRDSKKEAWRALSAMEQVLGGRVNLVIFPEGTTTNGAQLRKFKSGLFDLSARGKAPVIPLSLKYTHLEGRAVEPGQIDQIAWYGDMRFLPHFWNLLGIKKITARVHFNPALYPETAANSSSTEVQTRKSLAGRAYDRIESGLTVLAAVSPERRGP